MTRKKEGLEEDAVIKISAQFFEGSKVICRKSGPQVRQGIGRNGGRNIEQSFSNTECGESLSRTMGESPTGGPGREGNSGLGEF